MGKYVLDENAASTFRAEVAIYELHGTTSQEILMLILPCETQILNKGSFLFLMSNLYDFQFIRFYWNNK